MAGGSYSRDKDEPIPNLGTIGDPVLENIWNQKKQRSGIQSAARTRNHLLYYRGDTYAIWYRQLDGLSALPLYAGRYAKLEKSFGPEFLRLWRAAAAGLGIVILAALAALWLGRKMARPVRSLAAAADQIRTLQLDPPPYVDRTKLIELDDAAVAFNSTITGLKWF